MPGIDTTNWKRVYDPDGLLSLLLPPDWETEFEDSENLLVAFPSQACEPLIQLKREPGQWSSAKDYKFSNVVCLQESIATYHDYGGGEWEVDGLPISWHAYSSQASDGERYATLCFFLLAGDNAYLLECGASEENFSDSRPLLEAIGGSIRLEPGIQSFGN